MNKKALVTGASRGIGEAIARKLAKEHYDLYLTCLHSEEKLRSLATYLEEEYNVSVGAFLCDMSSYKEVERLFRHIPSLDVLINNAGISHIGLLSEMSCEEWQKVINTNLSSLFYTSKKTIPLMLQKHRGKIINISSVWGSCGASMEVAYSASKGGVNSFTKALAKELAPSGIQVNAIACGLINTEMNLGLSEEERRALIDEIPASRMGNAAEVAEMVCSVLSMPSYTTGQIFTIDGGWR
ncbi:MAG: SDR family NAD(P)-dependent oxidoreductase [Lachnospiraceae bacterium]|nr:SDR family NAD(P)-dependent oxidoreductase [Lachnospiraceae bacterium]